MWINGEKLFNSNSFDEIGIIRVGKYHVLYGQRGKEKTSFFRYSDYESALVELYEIERCMKAGKDYCELKPDGFYDDVRKRD